MKRHLPRVLLLAGALSLAATAGSAPAAAQQLRSEEPPAESIALGRLTFMQRCAVCHTLPTATARRYGPALYKQMIAGNEKQMQERIEVGSRNLMPGFRYTLDAARIDAILDYLKTVEEPAP
jgi:mono/diheme cytochrome c family protein